MIVNCFVVSTFHHRCFDFSSSLFRPFTIVVSTFHHRSFDFSSSMFRPFTIVVSTFHHRCFDFSSSLFRLTEHIKYAAMALTGHRSIIMILGRNVHSDMQAYKTHDSMSKVKVTLRGQRSILCNCYLVRAITSQVIVVSL